MVKDLFKFALNCFISTKRTERMSPAAYKISEARARFSELIQRVRKGEEIMIAHGNEPVARLAAVTKRAPRRPGALRALLSAEEAKALAEAVEAPLSEADQKLLEGEGSDELWVGLAGAADTLEQ